MKIASLALSIVVFSAAAQAQVAQKPQSSHKPAAPVQKELSKMDNYQFIEDHLNTPGTLSMTIAYSLANGTHASETVDTALTALESADA